MHQFSRVCACIIIYIFVYVTNANSDIINANSCSQIDVQIAIDAASDNDTVKVPAGLCTWTTTVKKVPSVDMHGKAIILQGAGIDKTIITDGTDVDAGEEPLYTLGVLDKPFRITGFTFDGTDSSTWGIINIEGNTKNFRIDHCKFINLTKRGIVVKGYSYGVIDHCDFNTTVNNSVQSVSIFGNGDAAWDRSLTLGSAHAVYIEDCMFNYSDLNEGALDTYDGARYVFRYNAVVGTNIGHHGFNSSWYRGTYSFEIYNNSFTTSNNIFVMAQLRGGTGVVFNNVYSGNYTSSIAVTNYRTCCDYGAACYNVGSCDGTDSIDGNQAPPDNGYPCRDQIGRATNQVLEPIFEWNNTLNEVNADIFVNNPWAGCSNLTNHIQENRDYYNDTQRPDYTPYTYPHPLTIAPDSPKKPR